MFQAGVIGLVATPATYALEAAPIVVGGVMFLSGWDGYVDIAFLWMRLCDVAT